jgi:hypothetical protein
MDDAAKGRPLAIDPAAQNWVCNATIVRVSGSRTREPNFLEEGVSHET